MYSFMYTVKHEEESVKYDFVYQTCSRSKWNVKDLEEYYNSWT